MIIKYAVNAIVMASWGVGCNFSSFLDKLHLVVWLGEGDTSMVSTWGVGKWWDLYCVCDVFVEFTVRCLCA